MCSSANFPVSIRTLIPIILTLSLSLFALPSYLLFKKQAVSKLSFFYDQTPRKGRLPLIGLHINLAILSHARPPRSQVLLTAKSNGFSWPASFWTFLWHLDSTQSKLNWVVLSPLSPPLLTAIPFFPVMPKSLGHHCFNLVIKSPSFHPVMSMPFNSALSVAMTDKQPPYLASCTSDNTLHQSPSPSLFTDPQSSSK